MNLKYDETVPSMAHPPHYHCLSTAKPIAPPLLIVGWSFPITPLYCSMQLCLTMSAVGAATARGGATGRCFAPPSWDVIALLPPPCRGESHWASIFLNEPYKIVRVSIDIAEKYKNTVLEDHRQEKEKKPKMIKKRLTWLDWDVNTGNTAT